MVCSSPQSHYQIKYIKQNRLSPPASYDQLYPVLSTHLSYIHSSDRQHLQLPQKHLVTNCETLTCTQYPQQITYRLSHHTKQVLPMIAVFCVWNGEPVGRWTLDHPPYLYTHVIVCITFKFDMQTTQRSKRK